MNLGSHDDFGRCLLWFAFEDTQQTNRRFTISEAQSSFPGSTSSLCPLSPEANQPRPGLLAASCPALAKTQGRGTLIRGCPRKKAGHPPSSERPICPRIFIIPKQLKNIGHIPGSGAIPDGTYLFVAQGYERVYTGGAPGGDVARSQCDHK